VGVGPLCTALAVCVRLYDVVAGNGHLMARLGGAEASTAEIEGLRVAHMARALFAYTGRAGVHGSQVVYSPRHGRP
jgi:hypothetical protein